MKYLGYLFMFARWLVSEVAMKVIVLCTWAFAPLIVIPYRIIDGREWLIKQLVWFQSFDNPVDEWWNTEDNKYFEDCSWFDGITVEDFKNSEWLRYLGRYFWICRNPAYGFAQFVFGWEPRSGSASIAYAKGEWQSGLNNYDLQIIESPGRCLFFRYAFHLKVQWFFYKRHYLHINWGWKSHRGFTKLMISGLITPFRTWDK